MGIIVRPELAITSTQQRFGVWKPVFGSGYRLNRNHLLNQGLVFWSLLNAWGSYPINEVNNARGVVTNATWQKVDGGVALWFDAYGEIVTFPWNAAYDACPISISVRLSYGTWSGYYCMFGCGFSYSNKRGISIWREDGTGKVYASVGTGSANPYILSASGYGDYKWHWVTATHDGSYIYLYVDGASVATPVSCSAISYNGVDISLGNHIENTNQVLNNGYIYDAQIHKRCLSLAEIKSLHEKPYGTARNPRLVLPEWKVNRYVPIPIIVKTGPFPTHLQVAE